MTIHFLIDDFQHEKKRLILRGETIKQVVLDDNFKPLFRAS